jgi:hypothetical protein
MLNIKSKFVVSLLLTISSSAVFAAGKEFPVNARLFAGLQSVNPSNINDTITTQSLKKIENVTQYGVEILFPTFKYLELGARYTKHLSNNDENPSDTSTEYFSKIDQDAVMLMARVPFIQTDIFRADVFAGIGGTNTTVTIKNASQDGELKKTASEGWFGAPYSAAGASVSVGYKWIFFTMEGGYEMNKVDGFDRSGNVNSAINTLDLNGSYITIGLLFTGIPGSQK